MRMRCILNLTSNCSQNNDSNCYKRSRVCYIFTNVHSQKKRISGLEDKCEWCELIYNSYIGLSKYIVLKVRNTLRQKLPQKFYCFLLYYFCTQSEVTTKESKIMRQYNAVCSRSYLFSGFALAFKSLYIILPASHLAFLFKNLYY